MKAFDVFRRIKIATVSTVYKMGRPVDNYNKKKGKIHAKQLAFHRDPARNRWVFGGNRTGKTECGAVEAVYWATCKNEYRNIKEATTGWVVSLTNRVGRDVAQAKLLKYLDKRLIVDTVMLAGTRDNPERGIIDYILVRNKFGTISKIGFKSCDQGREKFQGASLDWVWFDEEPPFEIYQECLLRTLDRPGSCIWGTMTPLKGKTWVYEKIYLNSNFYMLSNENNESLASKTETIADGTRIGDKPEPQKQEDAISSMFMQWEDNPYLNASEIKKMQSSLSADVLESRKYGRFMEGTGLIFCEFDEKENVIDPFEIEKTWYTCISIDPGFTNPCAVLWLAVDCDENIYVVADYEVTGKMAPEHAKEIIKISERLGFQKNKNGFYDAIIDNDALKSTMGNEESVAQQFRNCGINVNTKVNKEVIGGIMRMKALFADANGMRKLFVFRNCKHLIKELRSYWWGDNERPVKKSDHCIDALRYFVTTLYGKKNTAVPLVKKENLNSIGLAKAQFIRENRANMY